MRLANPVWGAPRIHGDAFRQGIQGMAIREVRRAPRAHWQNAYVEPLIGLVRRECLNHFQRCLDIWLQIQRESRLRPVGKALPEVVTLDVKESTSGLGD